MNSHADNCKTGLPCQALK